MPGTLNNFLLNILQIYRTDILSILQINGTEHLITNMSMDLDEIVC